MYTMDSFSCTAGLRMAALNGRDPDRKLPLCARIDVSEAKKFLW